MADDSRPSEEQLDLVGAADKRSLSLSLSFTHTEVCLLDLKQRSLNSSFKGLMEKLWLREPLREQVQNIPDPADTVPVGFITIALNL